MSVIVTNARGQIKADKTNAFLQDIRRAQRAVWDIIACLSQCAGSTWKHASKDDVDDALHIVRMMRHINDSLERMILNAVRRQTECD